MSHIYTQERTPLSSNFSALAIGTLGVAAIFALLPLLMKIPNPFEAKMLTPPDPVAIEQPAAVIIEPPAPPPATKEREKPILNTPLPMVPLDQILNLLNPGNNGVGVRVDMGDSFLPDAEGSLELFLPGQLDQKPRVLVEASPLYPYSMQNSKTKGEVIVEFIINQNGRVERPRIVRASHRDFVQPAIDAVLKSKWQPGQLDGKDVRTLVRLPVNFQP